MQEDFEIGSNEHLLKLIDELMNRIVLLELDVEQLRRRIDSIIVQNVIP